jgi:hypothetical protein
VIKTFKMSNDPDFDTSQLAVTDVTRASRQFGAELHPSRRRAASTTG